MTLGLEDLFIQQRSSSEEKSIRPPLTGWISQCFHSSAGERILQTALADPVKLMRLETPVKLYRPTLLAFTIALGTILAGSASAEPRSTSSFITFEDQGSAAVQTATDNEGSVEDQITNRENRIVTTRHQVDVAGRVLKYTARAGRLPILD